MSTAFDRSPTPPWLRPRDGKRFSPGGQTGATGKGPCRSPRSTIRARAPLPERMLAVRWGTHAAEADEAETHRFAHEEMEDSSLCHGGGSWEPQTFLFPPHRKIHFAFARVPARLSQFLATCISRRSPFTASNHLPTPPRPLRTRRDRDRRSERLRKVEHRRCHPLGSGRAERQAALRGGKMQDVTFEGADTRKAAQLCEISMLLTDWRKAARQRIPRD